MLLDLGMEGEGRQGKLESRSRRRRSTRGDEMRADKEHTICFPFSWSQWKEGGWEDIFGAHT